MSNENERKNSKKGLIVAVIAIALIAIVGATYALFTWVGAGEKSNVIEVGTLTLTLDESTSEGILIQNAVPVTEEYALANYTAYTFTVQNTGTLDAKYDLSLKDDALADGEKRLEDANVRYSLTSAITPKDGVKGAETTKKDLLSNVTDRKLDTNVEVAPGDTVEYTLYLWIDEAAENEIQGSKFSAKINIDAVQNVK